MNTKLFLNLLMVFCCAPVFTGLAGDRNTMLLNAIRARDRVTINVFLDIMKPDEDCGYYEESALMAAIYREDKELVELLIAKGSQVNRSPFYMVDYGASEEETFCHGKTCLALAVCLNNKEITELLLKAGARVGEYNCYQCNRNGSIQKYCHTHSVLEEAAYQANEEIMALLLSTIQTMDISNYASALIAATGKRSAAILRQLLACRFELYDGHLSTRKIFGEDWYGSDKKYLAAAFDSSLCYSAKKGFLECATLLLDASHEIHIYSPCMLECALALAVANNHSAVIDLLLSHNAHITERVLSLVTDPILLKKFLDKAGSTIDTKALERTLVRTCAINSKEYDAHANKMAMIDILLAIPVSVECITTKFDNSHGCTYDSPLGAAVASHDQGLIAKLIHAGANVNAQSGDNRTALTVAVECGFADTVELLLSHGANPKICKLDGTRCRSTAQKDALACAVEHLLAMGDLSGAYFMDKVTAMHVYHAAAKKISYKEALRWWEHSLKWKYID